MKTSLMILAAAAGFVFLGGQPVQAQYYNQNEVKYDLVVDKLIRPINEDTFYDNLNKDKFFAESDQIEFKVVVSNKGTSELQDLKFTDNLPSFVDMLFFPGSYDKNNRTITDTISKLGVGETKIYLIRGKISNSPKSEVATYYLQTNKACAANNLTSDCDNAKYYLASQTVPVTGNEMIFFQTGLAGMLGVVALKIRKLVRGY